MQLRSILQFGAACVVLFTAASLALASTPEQSESEVQPTETPAAPPPDAQAPEAVVDDFAVEGARPEALPIIEELTPEQIGENPDSSDDAAPGGETEPSVDAPIILLDPEFPSSVDIDLDALPTNEEDVSGDIALPDIDGSIVLDTSEETSEDVTPETDDVIDTSSEAVESDVTDPSVETDADSDEAEADAEATSEVETADDVAETQEQALPVEDGRASPPMWRLADDDSEIWLLGTFHILPPGLDWRSDPLAKAIDAADTIYFEAEVDTPDAQQKTIQTLMTEGFLPKEQTLSSLLEEDEAQKLQEISEQVGLPFAAIDTMRPWQAFLTTTVQYIVSKGFDPGSGVETILLKEARLRDRNLQFFETVEEQLSLFTSLKT